MVDLIPFLRAISPIVRRSILLSGVIERSKDTVISTLPLALITLQNVMISSSVGTGQ